MSGPLRVVGLDLSLTSTGMSDGQSVHAVQTKADELTESRMLHICTRVLEFIESPTQWTEAHPEGKRADLAVVEGAAFGAKGSAVDQLAGLRWLIRCMLHDHKIPFAVVSPSTLKSYTTGNGRATKAEMVQAVGERHGLDLSRVKLKDGRSDMADAYALAAMGYAKLGQPLCTLEPPRTGTYLSSVGWPAVITT